MDKLKIVTVLKSGPKWLPEYVYNFKKGVDKHITIPYDFVCLSDLSLSVPTLPLNEIGSGFWSKIQIFRPEFQLTGPCLYFDLDTIITNNIDSMIEKFFNHNFLMLEDFWHPGQGASGILWWQGDYSNLWNEYVAGKQEDWSYTYRPKIRYGDQAFIRERVDFKLIQQVIQDSESIKRFNEEYYDKETKIWVFGEARFKPWLFLDHPIVSSNWS